jgi:hypothetical protein
MNNFSYSDHIEDEYFLYIVELYLSKQNIALDNQTNFKIIKHEIIRDIADKILSYGPTDTDQNYDNTSLGEVRIYLDILAHINETLNAKVS